MSQQTINVGAAANDGTGDPLRTGGQKINANFTELYLAMPTSGAGSPEGVVDGSIGRTYVDTNTLQVYMKTTASGTLTGWI